MIYTLKELQDRILPIAEKYRIPAMYVFGSYARGDATEHSDIDILFRRKGSEVKGFGMGLLYEDLHAALRKKVDLVTMEALENPEERSRSPWFIHNVEREKVAIYERQ